MIDNNNFISNDGNQPSSDIRKNIQNKNLLSLKGDLYSNTTTGVIHLGGEGKLLGYNNIYEFALRTSSMGELDFVARESLASLNNINNILITKEIVYNNLVDFYTTDFLSEGENNMAIYQFNLKFSSSDDFVSFSPVSFIKKKAFSEYFQINFVSGINDENYIYQQYEKYYYYESNQGEMINIPINSETAFLGALSQYRYLYTKKKYITYSYSPEISNILKIEFNENGIYGVYKRMSSDVNTWEKIAWEKIIYTRIK